MTSPRTARSHRHRTRRSLAAGVESLESRRLMAVAKYEVSILADDDGVAGEVMSDPTFEVGDTFYVQIDVGEYLPRARGVVAAAVDVHWDEALLDVVESDFRFDEIFSENLPTGHGGELDNDLGKIQDLRADNAWYLPTGRAIGDGRTEMFARIRMTAQASGQPAIWVGDSQHPTVTVSAGNYTGAWVNYGGIRTEVVAAGTLPDSPVPIEVRPQTQMATATPTPTRPAVISAATQTVAQPAGEPQPSQPFSEPCRINSHPLDAQRVAPPPVRQAAPVVELTPAPIAETTSTVFNENHIGPVMPSWMRQDAFNLLQSLGLRWDSASGRWVDRSQGASS